MIYKFFRTNKKWSSLLNFSNSNSLDQTLVWVNKNKKVIWTFDLLSIMYKWNSIQQKIMNDLNSTKLRSWLVQMVPNWSPFHTWDWSQRGEILWVKVNVNVRGDIPSFAVLLQLPAFTYILFVPFKWEGAWLASKKLESCKRKLLPFIYQ